MTHGARFVAIKETWKEIANRVPVLEVNEQHFEYWRAHARSFESMAQFIVLPANLTGLRMILGEVSVPIGVGVAAVWAARQGLSCDPAAALRQE